MIATTYNEILLHLRTATGSATAQTAVLKVALVHTVCL